MDKDSEIIKKKFLHDKGILADELINTFGNVSNACNNIAKGDPHIRENWRQKHYYWMNTDPEYSDFVESLKSYVVDMAKTVMMEGLNDRLNVAERNKWAQFVLKTLGKNDGFTERTETDITSGGKALEIKFNIKPPSK
jgi:hypothetical protein